MNESGQEHDLIGMTLRYFLPANYPNSKKEYDSINPFSQKFVLRYYFISEFVLFPFF